MKRPLAAALVTFVSISRSRKRFGVIAPIMGVARDDSRKYLYYQGDCKAA